MSDIVYYLICAALALLVLLGIYLMSKVKFSRIGNGVSAIAMLAGIIVVLIKYKVFNPIDPLSITILFVGLAIGSVVGLIFSVKVKMIQMPQMVALLNGLGGAASAIVGALSLAYSGNGPRFVAGDDPFSLATSALAISVGMITLIGSLIAAGKLHRILPQKPIVVKGHQLLTTLSLVLTLIVCVLSAVLYPLNVMPMKFMWILILVNFVVSGAFGALFSMRVGGADMPITISLLNSLSGVAGAIAGLAINDLLLVAVGGIVGASGLLLTRIMCKAINRSLSDILLGKTSAKPSHAPKAEDKNVEQAAEVKEEIKEAVNPALILAKAKDVIIVPGYGMAIAQAQHLVKRLADKLEKGGAKVRYAIHPVAGRMPGHMNVLLCEADVDYESLYEMDAIDNDFEKADACVVVGANDVTNPAARSAEGTPIYGMPILSVDKCKNIFIFNYDTKPGYAGVDNPLYTRTEGVYMYLGNAAETLARFMNEMDDAAKAAVAAEKKPEPVKFDKLSPIRSAKKVIIVPGYGMAIAQAQHLVKRLADKLVERGAEVKYAIHPVAGRMPGHMNVLLCEADVDYESLYEMKDIDDEFETADAAIIVGANDVTNPAARSAVDTPIYGMPVLSVDKCRHIYIFNYDTKPGYAGVDNPLYSREEGVYLYLGNAAETLAKFISDIDSASATDPEVKEEKKTDEVAIIRNAKKVIIVPGYGMAIAQAQHQVKKLADKLSAAGAEVKYAIHPVAGRMPGHMNVLLCEADVDYESLYEMKDIDDEFETADAAIIVGANDVTNPAARSAVDTPIYGMPVLSVDKCKNIFIFNFDTKPGYAGVDNPLYTRSEGVYLHLGNAAETLAEFIAKI
ncbi:MAG TPA: NAD(P)(+) transhydrogenase (Re/Si-specific) subunit beta [Clostridia bacterium]|jgi:NAD(P) transhydrogenase subunit beta|nr:NAD(P)(+) transhydrogenase (Re/Si-specific) subunit beta [Clostridia bacterium]